MPQIVNFSTSNEDARGYSSAIHIVEPFELKQQTMSECELATVQYRNKTLCSFLKWHRTTWNIKIPIFLPARSRHLPFSTCYN